MTDENQERPKRITAQMRFKLYLETRSTESPVGEILRRYGLHLTDLREIEQTVEQAAVGALKISGAHKSLPAEVSPEEYQRVITELQEKNAALANLTVEYQLLKKKHHLDLELEKKRKSCRSN